MCLKIIGTILLIILNSVDNIKSQNGDPDTFELSSVHINFCGIGSDFQRDLVYSLVYDYQYSYIIKIARLYREARKGVDDIENLIVGIRNKRLSSAERHNSFIQFQGHIIELNTTLQKTYQELEDMTNNVLDGVSKECAILIYRQGYFRAVKMLVDIGNDGLIYSIMYLLYLATERTPGIFLDHVYKFNQELLDKRYHIRASTVYLCAFSILVGDKQMFTHSMVRLAAYAQITSRYMAVASRDLAKYDYIKMRKRYGYIRTGSPTGLQLLIWSSNKYKCIINKKFNEIMLLEPPQRVGDGVVYTQNYTTLNYDRFKFRFEFNLDDFTHRIMNGDKYIHLSRDLIDGLPKITARKEYEKGVDSWRMIPIGNNEFHIENSETKEKIIAGPDFVFTRSNLKRRVFAHRRFLNLEKNYLTGIDVWSLLDC